MIILRHRSRAWLLHSHPPQTARRRRHHEHAARRSRCRGLSIEPTITTVSDRTEMLWQGKVPITRGSGLALPLGRSHTDLPILRASRSQKLLIAPSGVPWRETTRTWCCSLTQLNGRDHPLLVRLHDSVLRKCSVLVTLCFKPAVRAIGLASEANCSAVCFGVLAAQVERRPLGRRRARESAPDAYWVELCQQGL
jgi:hypothetical protein